MKRKVLACLLAAMCVCSSAAINKTDYSYTAKDMDSSVSARTGSVFATAAAATEDTATDNALDALTGTDDTAADGTDTTGTDTTGTDTTGTDTTGTDTTGTDTTGTDMTGTDTTGTDTTGTDETGTDTTAADTEQTTDDAAATDDSSQTAETSDSTDAETVSDGIELDEDIASMSSVILARMVADYDGLTAYDKESGDGNLTFWTEMSYLVTAYGTENSKISYDKETGVYTLKKTQLRYYAASLYSELGKAKKLPAIDKDSSEVTKKFGKWKFNTENLSDYDISFVSCSKENDEGVRSLVAYLVNKEDSTSLGKYAIKVTKSPYSGKKKNPFEYSIVSIDQMAKMPMENILVGRGAEASASSDQTTDTSAASTDTGSTSSYGGVLSMPGTSTDTSTETNTETQTTTDTGDQTAAAADQTTDAEQTDTAAADATTTDPDQVVGTDGSSGQASEVMQGASISSDSAMKVAQNYYGTKLDDGTEYTYTYQGVATYMDTNYYNFAVSDSAGTVINILVSGDGARVFKGTNTNGTWTMQ